MATHNWKNSNIVTDLLKNGMTYHFNQAMRLLKQNYYEIMTIANAEIVFPTNHIKKISLISDNKIKVEQTFFSLLGHNSILPLHYREFIIELIHKRNYALHDFLQIFNDRLTQLSYKIWEKSHFFISYENHREKFQKDKTLELIYILTGLGKNNCSYQIEQECIFYYAGLLSRKIRSKAVLQQILSAYFNLKIIIEECTGDWIAIPMDEVTQIGQANQFNQLGHNAVIGKQFWSIQNRFTVHIGPIHYSQLIELFPNKDLLFKIKSMVRFYVGITYSFIIIIHISTSSLPKIPIQKKSSFHLGWNSWLSRIKNDNKITQIKFKGS